MNRPPVTASPWVIAAVVFWLAGAALIVAWAAGVDQPLPAPPRSAAR
ncbi:hypothetical protein [Brevundimonas sp. UBA7664]|nr:hypothetical protein [Brevundimonas sp. UBA7664]